MPRPTLALAALLAAALWAGTAAAQGQFPTSRAPVGGATGARSATPYGSGWAAGQAPSSDFDRQGAPLTRTQRLRRESAASVGQQRRAATPQRPRAARRAPAD